MDVGQGIDELLSDSSSASCQEVTTQAAKRRLLSDDPSNMEQDGQAELQFPSGLYSRNGKSLVCDFCGRFFRERRNLKSHLRVHTGEKPYVCDICSKRFAQRSTLKTHKDIHTRPDGCSLHGKQKNEGKFKCDVCGYAFNKPSALLMHTSVHTGEKPFSCDFCKRLFARKGNLKCHLETCPQNDQGRQKSYLCDMCGRCFTSRQYLKNHVKIHTNDRAFPCEVCDKRFITSSELRKHQWCHKTEKPYCCGNCPFTTALRGNFTRHLKTHEKSFPFACECCDKRFKTKTEFERHQLIHPDELTPQTQSDVVLDIPSNKPVQRHRDHHQTHSDDQPHLDLSQSVGTEHLPRISSTHDLKEQSTVVFPDIDPVDKQPIMNISQDSQELPRALIDVQHVQEQDSVRSPDENVYDEQSSMNSCQDDVTNCQDQSVVASQDTVQSDQKQSIDMTESKQHTRPPLSSSIKISSNDRQFLCDLKTNTRVYTDRKPFTCDVCNRQFLYRSKLRTHKKTHNKPEKNAPRVKVKNEGRFKCEVCGYAFPRENALVMHNRIHTGEKPYSCEFCNRHFAQKGNLKSHQLTCDQNEKAVQKSFICNICGRGFNHKQNLKCHIKIHTNDRAYPCDNCERRFITSGELKVHQWSHKKEKPYYCGICGFTAALRANFTRHLKTHEKNLPFSCDRCDKRFKTNSELATHQVIHSDGPFAQGTCKTVLEIPSIELIQIHEDNQQIQTNEPKKQIIQDNSSDSDVLSGSCDEASEEETALTSHTCGTVLSDELLEGQKETSNHSGEDGCQDHPSIVSQIRLLSDELNVDTKQEKLFGNSVDGASQEQSGFVSPDGGLTDEPNLDICLDIDSKTPLRPSFDATYQEQVIVSQSLHVALTADDELSDHSQDGIKKEILSMPRDDACQNHSHDRVLSDEESNTDTCQGDFTKDFLISNSCKDVSQERSITSSPKIALDEENKKVEVFPEELFSDSLEDSCQTQSDLETLGNVLICDATNQPTSSVKELLSNPFDRDQPSVISVIKVVCNKQDVNDKQISSSEKGYLCDICGRGFRERKNLKGHLRVHTGEKPYSCNICNRRFAQNSTLKSHKITHIKKIENIPRLKQKNYGDYKCDICGYAFEKHSALLMHKRVHTGEKPFSCRFCNRHFASKGNLKCHETTCLQNADAVHGTYVCEICGRGFNHKSNMKSHIKVHNNERAHACDVCDKRFITNGELKVHQWSHRTEKPYCCGICGFTAARRSTITLHMQSHFKNLPFACDRCDKHFKSKCELDLHQTTHTDE